VAEDDDPRPVYVGVTSNLKSRLNTHQNQGPVSTILADVKERVRVYFRRFDRESLQEALAVELALKQAFDPKYNKRSIQQRSTLFSRFRSRAFAGAVMMYASIGLYFIWREDEPVWALLASHGRIVLPFILASIGAALMASGITFAKSSEEARFVDVDARRRESEKIRNLAEVLHSRPVSDKTTPAAKSAITPTGLGNSPFIRYFDSIRVLLEEKASSADEKASILLDKGTAYSRNGIIFFVGCIIVWQVLAHFTGFQVQYLYGIASTSLLFVFIEFLSAWFLKQYRQFIDTSTYLIKVKSILDRYMLVYLASREAIDDGNDDKHSNRLLLELLRSDIQWPDSYLTRNPDISFAKEALETVSLLVKSARSEAKEAPPEKGAKTGGKAD
jgi:predicted GIY-YIG superfamily endonuclease